MPNVLICVYGRLTFHIATTSPTALRSLSSLATTARAKVTSPASAPSLVQPLT